MSKTIILFTALFFAFFIFSQTASALTGSFTVYSGNVEVASGTQTGSVPAGQNYTVSVVGTCGVNCDNIIMRLYENDQLVEWPSPGNINRSCSAPSRSCSLQWNFTKSSVGSFRYKAMIGNYGKEPGITADGPTITVAQASPPPPPPTTPPPSPPPSGGTSDICLPPYDDFVGSFQDQNTCKSKAPVCFQSGSTWYGYNKTNVGKTCATNTGASGKCDTKGTCAVATGGTPGQDDPIIIPNPLAAKTFQELLDTIVSFILWVGLAVAPVVIIIAGFFYVTSAGSPQRIETAKTMITYSLVGVAVLLLATGLVQVLKSILGVK